jgi:TPR repeat protein
MRITRNPFPIAGLLLGLHVMGAAPAAAQSERCAELMSAQQKVKCVLVNGGFAELEQMLTAILPEAPAEDLRLVIEGLEHDRLQGNVLAMLGLGVIHEKAISPFPQDVSRAAEYYLDAAAAGSTDGMLRVAMFYCDDRIPAPDLECLYFLRNAAEFGKADALLILAEQLVEKADDIEGAKAYLEKAVGLGVPGAEDALRALLQSRI